MAKARQPKRTSRPTTRKAADALSADTRTSKVLKSTRTNKSKATKAQKPRSPRATKVPLIGKPYNPHTKLAKGWVDPSDMPTEVLETDIEDISDSDAEAILDRGKPKSGKASALAMRSSQSSSTLDAINGLVYSHRTPPSSQQEQPLWH